MVDKLTKLSNKYKCDKSDRKHGYTSKYNLYLKEYKDKSFNMLEFGFGLGKSVKMWLEYFSNAKMVTVDVRPIPEDSQILSYISSGRLKYIVSDQTNRTKILDGITKYKEFLLVIDDASHVPEDQQFTFGFMFPFVQDGGWYVIEDLKCKRSHSNKFPQSDKTFNVLHNFIRTSEFNSPVVDKFQQEYIAKNIDYVKIYDKIAFIKKR